MKYGPLLSGIALAAVFSLPSYSQTLSGCPMFPADNVWNTPIDTLPVHANSASIINTMGATRGLHPDFGTIYGIPFVVVPGSQTPVAVTFQYADESDPGPYPIPPDAPIEGGASSSGDRHVLVLENTNCILYELYSAYPQTNGSWQAGSGAKFFMYKNDLRPAGWTSADAAGLPILPGLIRYDEVLAGEIKHAIRMTAPQTLNQYVWPARHKASSLTGSQYPPMGARFRLKASFDITPYPADVQVILRALKKYGALMADNGSAWYLTGSLDTRWNDSTLHTLGQVLGSNFEVVDESSLMIDPNSGVVASTPGVSSVQLNPTQTAGGITTTQNQVVLGAVAPAGGAPVALASTNPAVASVNASVLVPAGASSATFPVTTTPVSVSTAVTISATYLGVQKTASLTVLPPALTSVSVSPSTVTGGSSANGSVVLSGPAPSGGISVSLSSSDPSVTTTPAGAVVVPAGASSAAFTVNTQAVTATKPVTITASCNGVQKATTLTVNPVQTGSYTLQAPASGPRRQNVTVSWTAPTGHSGSDFVALYLADGSLSASRTTGTGTSGSLSMKLPNKPQVCRLKLVRSDNVVMVERTITVQ